MARNVPRRLPPNVQQAVFDAANGDNRAARELGRLGGLATAAKARRRTKKSPVVRRVLRPYVPSPLDGQSSAAGERDE